MSEEKYGPEDLSLWLTRPLGPYEREMFSSVVPGPIRCTINNVWKILMKEDTSLNIDHLQQALRATVFNQPNLRTDVNLKSNPIAWKQASDFTQLFTFEDLRKSNGPKNLKDIWPRLESETNTPWDYESGKPLFRCIVLRIEIGYVIVLLIHHAVGDGSTGMFILGEMMRQYELLRKGEPVELISVQPEPEVEELVRLTELDEQVVQKMLQERDTKVGRGVSLPFNTSEFKATCETGLPLNGCVFKEGDPAKYPLIRQRCREEGVTMAALQMAASYLATGAIHAKTNFSDDISKFKGIREEFFDVPINMRKRGVKTIDAHYCGFYVTMFTVWMDVDLESSLWQLARAIRAQLDTIIKEKQHLLYCQVKEKWEAGPTAIRAAGLSPETYCDIVPTNMHAYPFEMDFPWGTIDSAHTLLCFCAPGSCNYLFSMQTTNKINYDVVHCAGEENLKNAQQLLDLVYYIIEGAADADRDCTVKQLLKLEGM